MRSHASFIDEYVEPKSGWVVDVGAHDGMFLSWSLPLEEAGWNVLCIEGNPCMRDVLKKNRKNVLSKAVGDEEKVAPFYVQSGKPASYSGLIPHHDCDKSFVVAVWTLTQCLREREVREVAVLGIDVEGAELDVLRGFDFLKWRPRLIFVENVGEPVRVYLKEKGYQCVGAVDFDEVYVDA